MWLDASKHMQHYELLKLDSLTVVHRTLMFYLCVIGSDVMKWSLHICNFYAHLTQVIDFLINVQYTVSLLSLFYQ